MNYKIRFICQAMQLLPAKYFVFDKAKEFKIGEFHAELLVVPYLFKKYLLY